MDSIPDIDVFGDLPDGQAGRTIAAAVNEPRSWARFLAKTIDYNLAMIPSVVAMGLLTLAYATAVAALMDGHLDESLFDSPLFLVVFLAGHTLLFILVEAFCISVFGNTPGKELLGIRVVSVSGRRLSFGTSLKRSFLSVAAGLAFGIPLVNIGTQIYQYTQLNNHGRVFWDSVDSLQYLTRPVAGWRWAIAIVLFILTRVIELLGRFD